MEEKIIEKQEEYPMDWINPDNPQHIEDIKQQFCNELESILMGVRLINYKTYDGDQYPLLDFLSNNLDYTIATGRRKLRT